MGTPQLTPDQIAGKQEKLREEIRQRQELLKAYDLVAQDLRHDGSTTLPEAAESPITVRPHRTRTRRTEEPGYGHNTRLVRGAIQAMTKNYTFRDLEQYLAGARTPLSTLAIGTVLNRLKRIGEIKEFRKGSGRRPAIYKL